MIGVHLSKTANTNYYEETMLQGMIIGLAKMNLDEQINYISLFIPRINNWAVCDIFSSELKTAVRKGEETVWQFIQPYLKSQKEFEIRFRHCNVIPLYKRRAY